MVFSSSAFLFFFLPLVLLGYYLLPVRLKNLFLLVSSLGFYAWGEVFYVLVMLASIGVNYGSGLLLARAATPRGKKLVLGGAVVFNLGLLGWFKYGGFVVENLNTVLAMIGQQPLPALQLHLPIGISFFTFQAMSYVIDLYRNEVEVQRNPVNLALYISLFPQLIAGPIVRYHDVAAQLRQRRVTLDGFSEGVQRFIIGLGKKMLLANTLGEVADQIMAVAPAELSAPVAWLGIGCYALQIYFDFSGYSDMAIGLGRMFGFHFLENFNYPYIATSIRGFWRRWHISLSSWFRDYLYIPLGGSRVAPWRVMLNLWVVFLLCGLWHGASWNFVIWGALHGLFLVLERTRFGLWLDRCWRPVRHAYVLVVVLVAWVFFRVEALPDALDYIGAMAGLGGVTAKTMAAGTYLPMEKKLMLYAGVLLSIPWALVLAWVRENFSGRYPALLRTPPSWGLDTVQTLALMSILFLSLLHVASATYNPFIYFRF
ncbi:MBOAT family O-acyltransferase [Desulfovibrio ferrophilus]|uniref:Membrane bound O-acyl transferase MBOAT family protein n=1 Tax=Desulfovibrio ferrophilus TaxID=241368 RepID=A0A2Z6B1F5_9BACT|nr:MBOAT family protein [Desulfovibrio ferrophilus]BBD09357.1 membrane bound O-acyl transferase MBOAT family protein [Desulfovibrio ferrophilus]